MRPKKKVRLLISEENRAKIRAGAKSGGIQRAKNARLRQEAFPPALVAALNARHIDEDPSELIGILRGWEFEPSDVSPSEIVRAAATDPSARSRVTLLTGGQSRLREWDPPAAVRDADAQLIKALDGIGVTFYPGDPRSPQPLHLIPLHVAIVVLRRIVEGDSAVWYSATRALEVAGRDLNKGRAHPGAGLETAAAALNCIAAITMLRTYDRLPREVQHLLGRCQNLRCPKGRPFIVGRWAPARFCPGRPGKSSSCRARAAEADVHVSQR